MSSWVSWIVTAWLLICAVKFTQFYLLKNAERWFGVKRPGEGDGQPADTPGRWPPVDVIIPARNEEAVLAGCLERVLGQDYPHFRVILVDDRSQDRTREIAEEFARNDSRLQVVHNATLPPEWTGKTHALWKASRSATGQWLLFMDADVKLVPRALRLVMAEAAARKAKMLSLFPRLEVGGFWEELVIPLCGGILALWFPLFLTNDRRFPVAFANGQFILIERETYEKIGGFRAVAMDLVEDVALARRAKKSGTTCHVLVAGDLASTRMHAGYAGVSEGWSRIYVGALSSRFKVGATIVMKVLDSLSAFLAIPALAVAWAVSSSTGTLLLLSAICAVHVALVYAVAVQLWNLAGLSRRHVWMYPLSLAVLIRILLMAWNRLKPGAAVTWRGTAYRMGKRGKIEDSVSRETV